MTDNEYSLSNGEIRKAYVDALKRFTDELHDIDQRFSSYVNLGVHDADVTTVADMREGRTHKIRQVNIESIVIQ